MAIDRTDPLFSPLPQHGQRPELMLSAVLHLMSHYTASSADNGACLKLASVIERHLKALAGLPELAPVLSATCQQLSEQWAGVVERAMPRQPKHNLLGRIIARSRGSQARQAA
ncbi:MAG: hypothetical protein V4724_10995 [Pseudomonadota bacterium]